MNFKKIFTIVLALCMIFAFASCGKSSVNVVEKEVNAVSGDYTGKTVILHSNDVHGALEGYAYMPALKAYYEEQGATVILVDAGDFTNGSVYVSASKGESAVTLMNAVGYDVVTLGNHELDFGFEQLKSNLSSATFNIICSNLYDGKNNAFDSNIVYKVGDLKVGFFGLLTPETQTKVNPGLIQGLSFTEGDALVNAAKEQVEALKDECDLIVAVCHLGVDDESIGNRSYEVMKNVEGIDFMIDAHSHTVMTEGENGELIQSTGTEFANIGVIVIDNATKTIESHELVDTTTLQQESIVLATAQNIVDTVDEEFGTPFAKTSVVLDGEKPHVRATETNLGDLVCDSMIWSVLKDTKLDVDADHVVAITNGGGIRATIEVGEISKADVKTVLPFGNTIAVNYITGAELLESLEASTYALPDTLGGFPQIAGLKIKVDATVAYDAGEEYPDSTYAAPKSIGRVTILDVNGQEFDPEATYAVITNNFCAAGGDTYYAFKRGYDAGNGFDTSIPMDEALANYIYDELKCEIGDSYAEPAGRIEIIQ